MDVIYIKKFALENHFHSNIIKKKKCIKIVKYIAKQIDYSIREIAKCLQREKFELEFRVSESCINI